ncbi:uncharacterized protein LOC106136855 [Amyelois transitella]|uniref:uncharacterized protein LOC106136855 n=1 Tax=Amyelois transitella TaxID=680683 RepID=UPI00067D2EEA|nr:uncharacterized protein LOC106136855 [Amyelois transitella]
MSGKEYAMDSGSGGVREVKVHIIKPRRHTHCVELETEDGRGIAKLSSRSSDYVYVNSAFVGSVNNIAGDSVDRIQDPPTTVIREQYWACSKWPYGQKILALAVGILLGALIGLSISYAFKNVGADDVIGGIFRSNPVGE